MDGLSVIDADHAILADRCWHEVIEYYDDDVMRFNSAQQLGRAWATNLPSGRLQYVNEPFSYGHEFADMFGRIPRPAAAAPGEPGLGSHGIVRLCQETMDALGVSRQLVFPATLLNIGRSPVPYAEGQVALAYNRWFSERVASAEPRIAFAPVLPMRTPAVCEQIVQEMSGQPGVVAFSVSSLRYDRVYDNEYTQLYTMLAERQLPLIFRASPSWEWSDRWSRTMNRFLTIDALTTPYSNAVHLANWIVSGMPERFPALTTVWLRSGLASILFLAQRLDSLFPKRTSEAPALRRRPSEYLREMYFGSQPLEREHPAALEFVFNLINAENQLIYASAFPDWNFDPPSAILSLPFLSDNGRRNILGLTARRLFSL